MRKSQLIALLFAALAVAARLPFLLSHKIAFDSDEAVEGLMARHVLHGEFPAFFWGQAFKGVPEVYVSGGAFAIFGPGVTVLKSVTLMFFAAYVALNFLLLDKVAGRWIAVAASLLLILCPPALVFWSLDASAEYVLLMLLGMIFLLLCLQWQERTEPAPHRAAFLTAAIGFVIGLALWVQQLFVVYLLPAAILLAVRSSLRTRKDLWRLRAVPMATAAIGGFYLALAVVAFLTGGFSLSIGPFAIGARAPQKMLRIALGVGALAVLLQAWQSAARDAVRRFLIRAWPAGAGFLAGYSPVILYSLLVAPAHSPLRNANLHQLMQASPDIFGNVVPIILGFTLATTQRVPIPWIAAVPGVAALCAYAWAHRRDAASGLAGSYFPLFVISVPVVFLFSGAYLDTQSYRYLIPWYGGLVVAWAEGSLALADAAGTQAKLRNVMAAILVAAILAVHGWQQWLWYCQLRPDTQSTTALDCLRLKGIRGGYADYWTSYKLTFLSGEEIIIVPTDGVDRYSRYAEYVRGLPASQITRGDCISR